MKNKKWVLILAAAFVVLIVGASALYNQLLKKDAPDQLMVYEDTESPTATPEATASATPEPTSEPTNTPEPTVEPTPEPTNTPEPTEEPIAEPTTTELPEPTPEPTPAPTETPMPTAEPTIEPTATPAPVIAWNMPDFTVVDAAGNEVLLSSFAGKPIVLNFWASWCGPCKSEMPGFQEIYTQYGSDVQFLMVNMTGFGESRQAAMDYITSQGYTFPVYYDIWNSAAMAYNVTAIPATYFIDASGNGVAHASGAISKDVLLQGIGMILE